jgi:conjugative transposon TraJ protein
MDKRGKILFTGAALLLLPLLAHGQDADNISGLHAVLAHLYTEMIPLCSRLIGVARGIAGFAAIWYIGSRVWRHIARAEPIDFYPLFRPFVLGFCVMIFPSVLSMMNAVLQPTVTATAAMIKGSDDAVAMLLKEKEEAVKQTDAWQMYVGPTGNGDQDMWYQYTHGGSTSSSGLLGGIGDDIRFALDKAAYNFRGSIKEWMSELLQVLFEAASLCIDTLRTFQLIVLSILGPLVFGFAVFDGFGHTLTAWLARYINIFLWLPVANIFGSIIGRIQEEMLKIDIAQLKAQGQTYFGSTDTAYLVFLIIGIVGYFAVPSVANYIVHGGGLGALHYRTTGFFASSSRVTVNKVYEGAGVAAEAMVGTASRPSSSAGAAYMEERMRGNM